MSEVKARTAPAVAKTGGATISGARRFNLILKLAVVIFASVIALYPIVYVISASLNPTNTISDLVPANPTLNNYSKLATDTNYPILLWLFNSIKVSVVATIIGVFLTTIGAYAFSRFHFRGRRGGMLFILLIQLFPNTLALVSIYLLLLQIGDVIPWLGLNTHLGLIMVYAGGSLGAGTWLMKGFFDTIPKDIDESGVVDGATGSQIFFLLLLPLLRPILAVQAVLTFIGTYGDFILARVLLTSKDNYTMAVGLSSLLGDGGGNRASQWGLFAAGAVIGAVPVVIVFLFMQKQLVGGLTSGAVKG